MARLPSLKAAERSAKAVTTKAVAKADAADGPSPNPMTNLLIADLALRGGGQLLRHAIERTVLGAKFSPDKAKNVIAGRSMFQTLIGTAVARIATRSVPGAIVVGGGLLAKTLYDRRQDKRSERAKGRRAIEAQAQRGAQEDSDT
jgi:hypothetical protein